MTDKTQPDSGRATGGIVKMLHARIAELEARVQELGAMARENRSRRIVELEAQLEAVGAGGVQPLRKCLHHIEEPLEKVLERREAVIKILERDAHEAHQRAAHALGTRKVLWTLLGECSPLLHQLECNDRESEEQLNSLLRRIDDARAVVQAEELPGAKA